MDTSILKGIRCITTILNNLIKVQEQVANLDSKC